ncbi:acyltransferase [Paenibacillus allorhizosphaerae]|uniref:Acyltransferase 3 domain-containing protein n=1 Tax=Paenibacillus allorhizosphaerae TaxID=2849866 RepID=A0ABM8VP96_9BACL|nr:acyltransferase [Paenibacillus allorhizosphaerae]CAG7652305.1 hypothetical protein PAECIP111802_05189 [Paenibacillus allorhizosphaerae]
MRKSRIEEIEYLRAFAFLAVVLQHSIAHYAYLPETELADGVSLVIMLIASKFAVPLFIFITGLVLFYNYDGPFSYAGFLKKRFYDIVVPYLLWSVVYGLPLVVQKNGGLAAVIDMLRMFLTGKASYHLWYIVMILQFYLLFPLYRAAIGWLKQSICTPKRTGISLLAAAVVYIYLMKLVGPIYVAAEQLHIPIVTPMFTEYEDRNALFFFFYFVLGAVAGLTVPYWREWLKRYDLALHIAFYAMSAYLGYRCVASFETSPKFAIHYDDLSLLRPVMAVFLILSVLVLYRSSMRMAESESRSYARRLLTAVGQYSYGAYLAHALALTFATLAAGLVLPGVNVTIRTALAFALCASVSVLASFLLSKLPFGKAVTGSGGTRKKRVPAASDASQSMNG